MTHRNTNSLKLTQPVSLFFLMYIIMGYCFKIKFGRSIISNTFKIVQIIRISKTLKYSTSTVVEVCRNTLSPPIWASRSPCPGPPTGCAADWPPPSPSPRSAPGGCTSASAPPARWWCQSSYKWTQETIKKRNQLITKRRFFRQGAKLDASGRIWNYFPSVKLRDVANQSPKSAVHNTIGSFCQRLNRSASFLSGYLASGVRGQPQPKSGKTLQEREFW